MLTDVPQDELDAIAAGKTNPMESKKRLAHAVVALLHDEAAADAAQSEFERVFQRRETPGEALDFEWQALPFSEQDKPPELVSWRDLPFGQLLLVGGMGLRDYIATRGAPILLATFVSQSTGCSMSEAQRLIEQGAVAIDDVVEKKGIGNVKPGSVVRVGRHRFFRIGKPDKWT